MKRTLCPSPSLRSNILVITFLSIQELVVCNILTMTFHPFSWAGALWSICQGFYSCSSNHMIIQYIGLFCIQIFMFISFLSFKYIFQKKYSHVSYIHTHTLAGPHPLWILFPITLLLLTMTLNVLSTKPKTKARKIVTYQKN